MSFLDQELIGQSPFLAENASPKKNESSAANYAKQHIEFSYAALKYADFQPEASHFLGRAVSHPLKIGGYLASSFFHALLHPREFAGAPLKLRGFAVIRGLEKMTGLAIGILFPKAGKYLEKEADFHLACYRVHLKQPDMETVWANIVERLAQNREWKEDSQKAIAQVPAKLIQDLLTSTKFRQLAHLSCYLTPEQIKVFDWAGIKEKNLLNYHFLLRDLSSGREEDQGRLESLDETTLHDWAALPYNEENGRLVNVNNFCYLSDEQIGKLKISRFNEELIACLISDDPEKRWRSFDRNELKQVIVDRKFPSKYWHHIAKDILPELSKDEISCLLDCKKGRNGRKVLAPLSMDILARLVREKKLEKPYLKYFTLKQLESLPDSFREFVEETHFYSPEDSEDGKALRRNAVSRFLNPDV